MLQYIKAEFHLRFGVGAVLSETLFFHFVVILDILYFGLCTDLIL